MSMDLNQTLICPICKTTELVSTELEPNLCSFNCSTCEGHWIRGPEYWRWVEEHATNQAERIHHEESLTLAEPGKPIDCPECRFRMVKYLVGRGLSFTVDHCHGCKGIWLDRNEWEALRKRNLHDDLHTIFTSFWQTGAQRELRKKRMDRIYLDRFGAEDYEEIKRIRFWLEPKTNREELLAYLTDKDPYGV
jgi:Zn-finger nucleic acid-binding protein